MAVVLDFEKPIVEIQKKIDVMEENIPQAMTGEYPLSLEDLVRLIDKQKDMYRKQQEIIKQKEKKTSARSKYKR